MQRRFSCIVVVKSNLCKLHDHGYFSGISTMLGRLGACVLAQIPRLRALLLHNICLFGAGLSAVFIPLCYDYITMSITAFGYGLFMGMRD